MTTSSLLLAGILKPLALPWPAHAKNSDEQHDVDDRPGDRR